MSFYQYHSYAEILKGRTPLSRPDFENLFCSCPERVRIAPWNQFLPPAALWKEFLNFSLPSPKNFWVESFAGHGRIGANVSTINSDIGYIGFFEMQNEEVGLNLIQKAVQWLKSQNVKQIYGPVNFNTWFQYRYRTDQDSLQFSWEPHHSPRYLQTWLKAGFQTFESYHSQGSAPLSDLQAQVSESLPQALSLGYQFRPFNSSEIETQEVPKLYHLSMQGFADNFLFEPITEKAFQSIYVPIMKKADLSCSFWAMDAQYNNVGFFFAFIENEYIVLKSATLLKSARGSGVSNAMVSLIADQALKKGINKYISALVRNGAQSQSYGKKATELWRHEYALLTLKF